MALGSAGLAAAAVIAVLAALVLPSFGGYPSPGPAPPPDSVWSSPPLADAPAPPPDSWSASPADGFVPGPAPVWSPPLADAPEPAWGPASGPTPVPADDLCSDCPYRCAATCSSTGLGGNCNGRCSPGPECGVCRSTVLRWCQYRCSGGGCGGERCSFGCDCESEVESACYGPCYVEPQACDDCHSGEEFDRCESICNRNCAANCINE